MGLLRTRSQEANQGERLPVEQAGLTCNEKAAGQYPAAAGFKISEC